MSIITRTGDQGNTCLMYKRKVSKCHPRVEAYGAVDELNAAVGLARATARHEFVRENLLPIQQDLVVLMGELATAVEDLPRYAKDGYPLVTAEMRGGPERLIGKIESVRASFKGWATPGGNLSSASLDVARTVCRRSERRVCRLQETGQLENSEIMVYLNRLSDALWLLARWVESEPA